MISIPSRRTVLELNLEQINKDIDYHLKEAERMDENAAMSDRKSLQIEAELENNLAELAGVFSKLSVLDQKDLLKSEPEIGQEILAWQHSHGKGRV